MIKEIEEAIVTQLTPLLNSGVAILNTPKDTSRVIQRCADLLVFYSGKSIDPPSGKQSKVIQKQTLNFAVNLRLVDLRTHTKAYPILEEIQSLLSGWTPPTTIEGLRLGFFYQTAEDYVSLEKGVWIYTQSYSIETLFKGGAS